MRSGGCATRSVVDDGDAERRDERGFLHERVRTVSLAVAVGVLQHDDLVPLRLPGVVGAVAHPLGYPDASVLVDIDVGRVAQERRCGPQVTLEPSGTWKRSSGICTGWGAGPDRLRFELARTPVVAATAVSISTSITISRDMASRR
jgi:hypothetical protein